MKKILIANRGEIAVRIIRACHELGIKSVAVHSTADKDALHTKLADESICIGPGPAAKSYLQIPNIISAAEISGADAIHPGYGFLSENHRFAEICEKCNITFIGPNASHIETLGNKVAARDLATKSKVPLLPGSPGPIKTLDQATKLADKIGYPVIVKASAGGGGRGMKIVHSASDLEHQMAMAIKEAETAFGNGEIYIEKYLTSPRHVEVQVLADQHGNVVHFGERDCSVQRRHQKLIEEAPCPVFNDELRKKIGDTAVNMIKKAGYHSAATVEFLFDDKEQKFYFMEVNTRIQVEHPVTEIVTGVDLIKQMIRIAQGEKLPFTQDDIKLQGHAIECRINAEDPDTFAPSPGKIGAYHEPGGPGVRMDSMIYSGYTVPPLYDSMLAKLIAFGSDREEALARMRRALLELKIDGIKCNSAFHSRVMNDERFTSGNFNTHFLSEGNP